MLSGDIRYANHEAQYDKATVMQSTPSRDGQTRYCRRHAEKSGNSKEAWRTANLPAIVQEHHFQH